MTIEVEIKNNGQPGGRSLQVVSVERRTISDGDGGTEQHYAEVTGETLDPGQSVSKWIHKDLQLKIVEIP